MASLGQNNLMILATGNFPNLEIDKSSNKCFIFDQIYYEIMIKAPATVISHFKVSIGLWYLVDDLV